VFPLLTTNHLSFERPFFDLDRIPSATAESGGLVVAIRKADDFGSHFLGAIPVSVANGHQINHHYAVPLGSLIISL
jgi:hypothetical protein